MSRPKGADSKQTVESILATTLALLSEKPDDSGPSLREVARRADVSISTIQYYFKNKEELLEACLDGYYSRLGELAQSLIERATGKPDVAFIEEAARSFFRFCRRERGLVALRLRTNAKRGQLHPRRQDYFMGTIPQVAAKALEAHVEVSSFDTRLSIQAFSNIVVRFALFSDSELENLTDLKGQLANNAVEDYVVRAARRMLFPSKG